MESGILKTALAIGVGMLLAACGDGSTSSESGGTSPANTTTTTSGKFVDSSVDGLPYSTSSNPAGGITSGGGHFQCQPGDMVRFFLGARQIGNAQPCSSDTVTVVSVLGATSVTDPQVVNLTQLLLTLATSVTPSVMILPQPLPAGFNSSRVPAFTDPNFDADVLVALPPGTTLVTTAAATTHLQASLKTLSVTASGGTVTSTPVGINCVNGVGICSFVFETNAVVTLTATGTGFTGWSGGDCSGTGMCVVTMNADTAVTATFPGSPPPATLMISTTGGTGSGAVTCSANEGAFGVCSASYPSGTVLVLQGVGDSGSTFTSWTNGTGNASVCNGTTGNCSMTLNANTTVTAIFALNAVTQFSVTTTTATSNGGGGTVVCSANGGAMGPCSSYAVGTSISITPTPNSASNFTSWTNGTGSVTANCGNATGACTFTLTGNTHITANFNLPTLTVVLSGTGVGTVTSTNIAGINCGATCTAAYIKGSTVILAAAGGSGFSGWSGGGCSGTGTCVVTANSDSTITATFNAGLPPFAQQAYLKASNTGAWDLFGESLALQGDTLVVGALWEASSATGINGNQADNSAPNSGAVYVFTRTNGVWTQQAYLKASNTGAGDSFGYEIALSGDTLAVSAYGEASSATGVNGNQADNSAPFAGAVYVFVRTNGVWTQQAYIKASNTNANDLFGRSVALSGDTLAVSANGESSSATGVNGNQADNSAPHSGAVYVFTRTNGVWTQQAYIKASNTDAGDLFGDYAIYLEGDTLAVGAPGEASSATGVNGNQADNSAPNSGAVYLFTRTNGVWTQQAYIKASNTKAEAGFGGVQVLSGDTLAVAAGTEASCGRGVNGDQTSNNCAGAGAVYVFTQTNGVWTQQAYIKASNTDAGDVFGDSLALSGDTLAIGAQGEASSATGVNGNQADNSAPNSGAVYLFTRTNGVWTQQAYLKASNTNAGDIFGEDVRLSGNTLAVSAYGEASSATGVNGNQSDNSAPESGATYVFQQ